MAASRGGGYISDVLGGDRDWPGLAQVLHLARQVVSKQTGTVRTEGALALMGIELEN
jgi:hypothetical protein